MFLITLYIASSSSASSCKSSAVMYHNRIWELSRSEYSLLNVVLLLLLDLVNAVLPLLSLYLFLKLKLLLYFELLLESLSSDIDRFWEEMWDALLLRSEVLEMNDFLELIPGERKSTVTFCDFSPLAPPSKSLDLRLEHGYEMLKLSSLDEDCSVVEESCIPI